MWQSSGLCCKLKSVRLAGETVGVNRALVLAQILGMFPRLPLLFIKMWLDDAWRPPLNAHPAVDYRKASVNRIVFLAKHRPPSVLSCPGSQTIEQMKRQRTNGMFPRLPLLFIKMWLDDAWRPPLNAHPAVDYRKASVNRIVFLAKHRPPSVLSCPGSQTIEQMKRQRTS